MKENKPIAMTKMCLLLISVFLFFLGCSTTKKDIDFPKGSDAIVKTAISDFLTRKKLLNKSGNVFSVDVHNSIYRMNLQENTKGEMHWVLGQFYPSLVAVGVIAYRGKFIYADSLFESGELKRFPNQYLEVDGKLFYWRNGSDYPTKETIGVLSRYGLLVENDLDGVIEFSNTPISDNQKGVDYFFCKGSSIPFKIVVTRKALGYYDVPQGACR